MAEKRQRRNVPEDYDLFGEVFGGKAPKMTPEQKAENDRRKKELLEYCKQKGRRRQKLYEALLEEEKKTGMKVPFLLWLRFGIERTAGDDVLPEVRGELHAGSEKSETAVRESVRRRGAEISLPWRP